MLSKDSGCFILDPEITGNDILFNYYIFLFLSYPTLFPWCFVEQGIDLVWPYSIVLYYDPSYSTNICWSHNTFSFAGNPACIPTQGRIQLGGSTYTNARKVHVKILSHTHFSETTPIFGCIRLLQQL